MNEHRYILETYKGMNTRYCCPDCQQSDKTFSRYIDKETGEHIHPNVGRCNREIKCGYHYTPKQYFQDNNISFDQPQLIPNTRQTKPVSFIPADVFEASLKSYNFNHFVKYLIALLGAEVTTGLIGKYFIGTSKCWNGATVFWQIDTSGKIRTGKIMLYNPATGKRVKEPHNHITWAHKALKMPGFELKQCLYGEHLLKENTNPVAIVESEKTAIIASVYLPRFIWLAVGSLSNLTREKCQVLNMRTVVLFPDLNGFKKWSSKAIEFESQFPGTKFIVSDLLENNATEPERLEGCDLADYLIKQDWRKFRYQPVKEVQKPPLISMPKPVPIQVSEEKTVSQTEILPQGEVFKTGQITHAKNEPPPLWNIKELESFFASTQLPTAPVKLNQCTTIIDVPGFVESSLATAKAQNGNKTYWPYFGRLQELKQVLTINSN